MQLWHYPFRKRKPKAQTVKKIQKRMRGFAEELKQVQFID
jgi:hypothetical protein